MIKPSAVWSKVRRDLVLNLSELAVASGYDRGRLAQMCLPLQYGKISLSDFKRVLRQRQDHQEQQARRFKIFTPRHRGPGGSSALGGSGQRQAVADKLYGPSSKSAGKSASRQAQSAPLHSTV